MAPYSPSSFSVSSSRKSIAWLSLAVNILLLIGGVREWRRMVACDQAQQQPKPVLNPAPDLQPNTIKTEIDSSNTPHRRLLQLSTEAPPARSLGKIYPAPPPPASLQIADDLSDDPNFKLAYHEYTWLTCPLEPTKHHDTLYPFCPETAIAEQRWQMSWFGAHVVGQHGQSRPLPGYEGCAPLPPIGYQWPAKETTLPATGPAVHYPNLRIKTLEDLKEFNRATPKNLYHFDAPQYDLDALDELETGEKYIPFAKKIRLMLDVGAGGGSLGLLAKKKYDVQTLNTVFADWPYCEYITERGSNCILLDVMEALPMAKFSFDVLHISWVYHGQHPDELEVMFHELNRVLRPGGYLWLRGGWSMIQFDFLKAFLHKLGYVSLYSQEQLKPKEITEKIFFGAGQTLPYAIDWTTIWVKPIAKVIECGATSTTAKTTEA